MEAMRALWAGQDADWFNLVDEAKEAHPGADGTILALFGATSNLINRLAEVTGEDREEILRRVLDPNLRGVDARSQGESAFSNRPHAALCAAPVHRLEPDHIALRGG
jgi:hypothetical protein